MRERPCWMSGTTPNGTPDGSPEPCTSRRRTSPPRHPNDFRKADPSLSLVEQAHRHGIPTARADNIIWRGSSGRHAPRDLFSLWSHFLPSWSGVTAILRANRRPLLPRRGTQTAALRVACARAPSLRLGFSGSTASRPTACPAVWLRGNRPAVELRLRATGRG